MIICVSALDAERQIWEISIVDCLLGKRVLKKLIRQGNYLSADDSNQALVGKLLAKNLNVVLGDELVVLGQGRDGSIAATVVKVKGIFSSGQDEFDRSTIHIPLKYFQDVYAMNGAVHEVVALGKSLEYIPEIKSRVTAGIENMNQKDLYP